MEKENEYTIHWKAGFPFALGVMAVIGSVIVLIVGFAAIFFRIGKTREFNLILGPIFIIFGILVILYAIYWWKRSSPRSLGGESQKVVIDNNSIKLMVDNRIEKEILFEKIKKVGANWNYYNFEPIVGFWVETKDGVRIDFERTSGWCEEELRKGLEIILSFHNKLGFHVDNYLSKHLNKFDGIYKWPADKYKSPHLRAIIEVYYIIGILQIIVSIPMMIILWEDFSYMGIFLLILGSIFVITRYIYVRKQR